eukprot:gene25076-30594_t
MSQFGEYIYILVVKGEGLIICDDCGTSDPYVDVYMHDDPKRVKTTSVISNSLNPVWNHKLSFKRPNVGDAKVFAKFDVYDKDFMNIDFMGFADVEVGDVPIGEVKDVCIDLKPRGKMKLKYVGALNTSYGKITLKISSGHERDTPDLNAIRPVALPMLSTGAGAGGDSPAPATQKEPPELSGSPKLEVKKAQTFIYVSPIRAKNLIATDYTPFGKKVPGDPYCAISINDRSEVKRTNALKRTLNPDWNPPEPFSFPFGANSRTLLVEILDCDQLGFDESMGRVQLPIDESTVDNPGELKAGWYDVMPSPSSSSLKKAYDKNPEKLGQIYISYSVGYLKDPPRSKELAPAFRTKFGKLKVELLEMVEPRGVSIDDIYAKVLFEGRVETSDIKPLKKDSCSLQQAFEFDVTEICSDLTLELWDREVITPDERFGKVVVPLKSLWHFNSAPNPRWETWLLVMPAGTEKRAPYVNIINRPKQPVACLKVALTLTFNPSVKPPIIYVGNALLNDTSGATAFVEGEESAISNILVEVGRLVDALLSPTTSAIAVILFLQSWKKKSVNWGCIVLIYYSYFAMFSVVDYLFPVMCGIGLVAQGYLLREIRSEVPTFLYTDEKSKFMETIKEFQAVKQTANTAYDVALSKWNRKCKEMEDEELPKEQKVKTKYADANLEKICEALTGSQQLRLLKWAQSDAT